MAERGDAEVFQVLIGQVIEDREIDIVVSKALRARTCRAFRAIPQYLALRRTLPRTLRCYGERLSEPKALGHFGRGVLGVTALLLADAIPPRSLVVP
jgi:hypothetical protein